MFSNEKFFIVLACISLLLLLFLQGWGKQKDHNRKKLRDLQWGKRDKSHGIIFGRKRNKVLYSPINGEGSILCTAGTGMGKTSSLLIPTLRSWFGTSMTIDISGDISRNCPNMKNKTVFEVENENTIPYNIFSGIDKLNNDSLKNEALVQLSILLMPLPPNAPENAKFFNENGRKILSAA